MNDRPAKSRPGIPPDLAKAPFHQAAYETEKELAQQPKPEGAPDETGAPATAAATLFAERPTPAPKRPPAAGEKRPRPKLWIVFALTWATLIPLALLTLFTDLPLLFLAGRAEEGFLAWRSSFLGTGNGDRAPPPMLPVTDPWVDGRLKEADQAVADGDLARAIRIYQEVAERTGEATWKARIQDLQRQIAQQEKQRRLDDLRERLKLAEQMASDRRYDDALAVLRNIGAEDRELLATINVSVARMQQTIEDGARRWRAEQEQRQALASRLAEAERLVADGKLAEALALYDRIASEFPARLVREKADLEPIRADLKARIEASAQPPTPPTPPETPPAETVRKLFDEAVALENEGKFAEALGKLEAIKKFDKKSWPENLEEKIKSVTAKKEALEFFGIND